MSRNNENNRVVVSGEILENFLFDHESHGEGFHTALIASKRRSGARDFIPIIVSDRIVDVSTDWVGAFVRVSGEFRSYNKHEDRKNRLVLHVFVNEFETWEEDGTIRPADENHISLDGYICKPPIYRKTPLGREIADILLAVNRPYGKSDYIPCIAWGRNARFVGALEVGTRIQIDGRIQSREYRKRISDDEYETRVAYEVNASRLTVVEEMEGE